MYIRERRKGRNDQEGLLSVPDWVGFSSASGLLSRCVCVWRGGGMLMCPYSTQLCIG